MLLVVVWVRISSLQIELAGLAQVVFQELNFIIRRLGAAVFGELLEVQPLHSEKCRKNKSLQVIAHSRKCPGARVDHERANESRVDGWSWLGRAELSQDVVRRLEKALQRVSLVIQTLVSHVRLSGVSIQGMLSKTLKTEMSADLHVLLNMHRSDAPDKGIGEDFSTCIRVHVFPDAPSTLEYLDGFSQYLL